MELQHSISIFVLQLCHTKRKGWEMLSVRLSESLEKQLISIAHTEQKSKTEIVKNALLFYIDNIVSHKTQTPYDLGKDFFGKYGSGENDLSSTYKTKIKEKLSEKYHH